MLRIKNIFSKQNKGKYALCFMLFALCFVPAYADEDPFAFDSYMDYPTEEEALPDNSFADFSYSNDASDVSDMANVTDGAEPDLTMPVPLYLNENAAFAAVGDMDIAGTWLGMKFEKAEILFFKSRSLYSPRKNNAIVYSVPKDWKYNFDYECRQQKIIIPTEIEKCVNSFAKKRGVLYASEMHLVRESTGETIELNFTSNATGNKIWRVIYNNDANVAEGDAEKFSDQRDKKVLSFWQGVLDKYGPPNSGADRWISSDNSFDPMMTAYYGQLILTDLGLAAMDAAENRNAARGNFRAKPYAF